MRFLLSVLVLVFTVSQASAFDIETMTDAERDIFRQEIRAYLLENPEVLMEAIGILEQRRTNEAAQRELALVNHYREPIFNDGFSFVGGNPDGDVTIVEFLDYRCGFCKRAFPAVEELLASDGNIRLIVKEFPILGDQSTMASKYAIATKMIEGDKAYKEVHDEFMRYGGQVNLGFLARMSRKLDLDHDEIAARMESEEVDRIINDNRRLASALEIQGTPSFVMGDSLVRGFLELDQMRAIVDDIRAANG